MQDDTTTRMEAVSVDETKLKAHVDEVLRSSVEDALNTMLVAARLRHVADALRIRRYLAAE